jgi:hypothetical protein
MLFTTDYGGALYANAGTADLDRCTITGNSALYDGGAVDNEGGAVVFHDCTLSANTATRGGAAYSTGKITWIECSLSESIATSSGGALYQIGGEIFWNDCVLTDNRADDDGAIVSSESNAETRFDRCVFMGDYDSSACVFFSDDTEPVFMFCHTIAFASGIVCSASQTAVYNSNISIPMMSSSVMTCQSSDVLDYCGYDCTDNDATGGITCTCTVDE